MAEHNNPWQILSQKNVYDNKWISLTEFDVINPGGGKGIYGKVHFKNIAIGIVVLDNEMNTWLVGQYRFPLDAYSWELPEGGGPLDKDPLDSAKLELLEETGLVAKDWTVLLNLHLSNSVTDEYAIIYLARDLEQHKPQPEESEQLIIRKLPFDSVWEMVSKGEITDVITVAGIQKIKIMLMGGEWRAG